LVASAFPWHCEGVFLLFIAAVSSQIDPALSIVPILLLDDIEALRSQSVDSLADEKDKS
jgi:hypothetical protein